MNGTALGKFMAKIFGSGVENIFNSQREAQELIDKLQEFIDLYKNTMGRELKKLEADLIAIHSEDARNEWLEYVNNHRNDYFIYAQNLRGKLIVVYNKLTDIDREAGIGADLKWFLDKLMLEIENYNPSHRTDKIDSKMNFAYRDVLNLTREIDRLFMRIQKLLDDYVIPSDGYYMKPYPPSQKNSQR